MRMYMCMCVCARAHVFIFLRTDSAIVKIPALCDFMSLCVCVGACVRHNPKSGSEGQRCSIVKIYIYMYIYICPHTHIHIVIPATLLLLALIAKAEAQHWMSNSLTNFKCPRKDRWHSFPLNLSEFSNLITIE